MGREWLTAHGLTAQWSGWVEIWGFNVCTTDACSWGKRKEEGRERTKRAGKEERRVRRKVKNERERKAAATGGDTE